MTSRPGSTQLRRYDADQRSIAARIQEHRSAWLVLWSLSLRVYTAYPRFDPPRGTIVAAPVPRELLTRMRETELAAIPVPHDRPGRSSARDEDRRHG